ncbi:MAG: hypothetical protein PQJ58_18255 [Spirochaetales bacterium]|nr:hypothetical protein [Spirochaetales bacterium]
MAKKNKKVPKVFRKKIKPKKWKKKILKNIHIPSDKKWIEERFELMDDRMVIKQDLPKEDLKKLKALGKSIKKNKGTVTKWKALILLAIAVLAFLFNYLFKNVLIKKGIETGIESIFEAAGFIENPDLSLSKGSFTFDSLSIQNKDKPDRNLITFGNTAIRINMPELSRNRYHIEEITLQGMQLNSSRTSGDLIDSRGEGSEDSGTPLIDIPDMEEGKEQVLALIEEHKSNLKSLQYIDTANQELEAFTQRWTQTFETTRTGVEDSIKEIKDLGSRGVPSVSSLEDARGVVDEYRGYSDSLLDQKKELESLNAQFNEEKERLLSMKEEVENLIQDDIDYLGTLLQLPGREDVQNFISDKVKEILMTRFQDYYDKAMLVMPYYEKWNASRSGAEENEGGAKRLAGSYIPFPTAEQPRFLIKKIDLSGGDNYSGFFNALVSGITSEPDKLEEPVLLTSAWDNGEARMSLDGFLDLKEDASQLFDISFSSPANPADFGDTLSALGIESAGARLSYTGKSIPHPDEEGVLVSLDMDFADLQITLPDKDDITTRLLRETVAEIKEFMVNAEVHIDSNGIQGLRVQSDADKIIKEKLGDLLKDLPSQGAAELEKYIRELVASELKGSEKINEALDQLGLESLSQIRSIEDLEAQVKAYEDEARSRGEDLLKEAEDRARAEAEKLKAEAEAARKEAEAKAAAEAAKAKAEAEAAAAAAQKAAEEKAKEEASKIKLPGF